jgi:hypothetical protein
MRETLNYRDEDYPRLPTITAACGLITRIAGGPHPLILLILHLFPMLAAR